jgi:RNA polymerase primary sigma factor
MSSEATNLEPTLRAAHSRDVYQRYLDELRGCPRLTPEEELALARTIVARRLAVERAADAHERAEAQAAYRRATDEMVRANLRLVVSVARRYGSPRLMASSDFIQEGNLGLLRAVERFDPERGVRFGTYAVWWIRFAFNRSLSDRGRLVRVPGHAIEEGQKLARATASLRARLGREPTLDELVAETGLTMERAAQFSERSVGRPPLSLDMPMGESSATLLDMLSASTPDVGEQLDVASFEQRVRPLLAKLTKMEAAILRYRFGLDDEDELTLREVGEKYGLTRERIRQVQEKALGKLRKQLEGSL